MAKQSAGLLVYRWQASEIEVLLVHPGGPFWANKDKGAWSIPKGEFDDEEPLVAAKREFQEEVGQAPPETEVVELGSTKMKSGKTIYVWASEGNLDVSTVNSSTFMMEWPPKSGQQQEFPEVDRANWFNLEQANQKLHPAQVVFIERLANRLGVKLVKPEQGSLF